MLLKNKKTTDENNSSATVLQSHYIFTVTFN